MLVRERDRLFAVIGALEEDLRSLIDDYLLATGDEAVVLGPAFDKARQRQSDDQDASSTVTARITDYLDIGDSIETLLRWTGDLPPDIGDTLNAVASDLTALPSIRNRVMHRRPLLPDDATRVEALMLKVEGRHFEAPTLMQALRDLRSDRDWRPVAPDDDVSLVLNNLPLVDYDETGLIGRHKDTQKLARLVRTLPTPRSQILTVVGPGGVGKTALVLQVLHDLVNDPECPFELVTWVSLKSERLTSSGVEAITDAVLSIEQAVPALIEPFGATLEASTESLGEALQGVTALVVIDNLETVSAEEVLDLVDAMPAETRYLFTSREGLGQLERRFPLGPLEARYGVDLLRRLFRIRDLDHLARMRSNEAEQLVERLNRLPLALRWYVAAVEGGADPRAIATQTSDLLRFCVQNVYGSLDNNDRAVAHVLYAIRRPATAQELNLFLPDQSADELRRAIQNLLRKMLISRDAIEGTLVETFESTNTLEAFLRDVATPPKAEIARTRQVEERNRIAGERHRRDAAKDPLRPNIIQGGAEHGASVIMLRDALALSRRTGTREALTLLAEAEEHDPEFWEVFRVRGFVLSTERDVVGATIAYERAMELSPDQMSRAAVAYFFAGHLSRAHEPERASELAREAHSVLGEPRTAIELGRALMLLGEFAEAESLLLEGLEAEHVRTRIISRTLLIECLRRRASEEIEVAGEVDAAVRTLRQSVNVADDALTKGFSDNRLYEVAVDCVSDLLRLASQDPAEIQYKEAVEAAVKFISRAGPRARSTSRYKHLLVDARRAINTIPGLREAGSALLELVADSDRFRPGMAQVGKEIEEGVVKAWRADRHFGFVYDSTGIHELFLHVENLRVPSDEIYLEPRAAVRFKVEVDGRGRARARDAEVVGRDMSRLVRRRIAVERVQENGTYLIARDERSGARIFVGRDVAKLGPAWNTCTSGTQLIADVEIQNDGRFAARAVSLG